MKKIEIVTILDVANFGTTLQAYASGHIIKELGYDVEFLDYNRPHYSPRNKFKTFCADKSLGNIFVRCVFGVAALVFYSYIRWHLRTFISSKFKFSKKFNHIDDIRKNPPKADIYLTGSDQVWNSTCNYGIDKVFFLDFAEGYKTSYAASIGMESFSDEELPIIKELLSKYKNLAVRETQSQLYLKNMGFKWATQVQDPSLLLDMEQWKKIIHYRKKKRSPYLLVYSVERFNNDFIFRQATEIAKAKGLKMYVISATYPVKATSYHFDKIYALAGIKQFLTLMIDADFVVASSFHGTAFAVNFNKDFLTISAKKYNIRMESFVNQFNISHRIVTDTIVKNADLKEIDYTTINKQLTEERKRSLNILRNNLNIEQ